MKNKFILLLLVLTLFLTGCSIKKVKFGSIDDIIDEVMVNKNNIQNTHHEGYSYYVPNTLKTVDKEEYNSILQDEYNNQYYIYVDVVGYYNKIKNTYKENKKSFYSKKIVSKSQKKDGYLEINEIKGKYFVEAVYNYGKIEVYTSKSHLNETLVNISEILPSIKYNNKVLATLIGDNILSYKEESFNIFTTKKTTSNYLDYIEQYDKSNDRGKITDDDQININSNDK